MISPECRDEVHDECSLGTGNCACWHHEHFQRAGDKLEQPDRRVTDGLGKR